MILLDTVVEVGTLPYPDRLQLASRLILEPVCGVTGQDGLAIGLTTIDYDPLGSAVSPESLSQKPFGGGQVTFFAEPELDRIAVAVNGAVQISPLTTYLDIRLIHMPFPPDGPFALIETLEKLGGVTDHPAADGGVVNGDAALCHHFLQIPQAQAISKIPPYAQQDHRSIKLPALEHLCHSLSPAQAIARDRKERVATDPAAALEIPPAPFTFRVKGNLVAAVTGAAEGILVRNADGDAVRLAPWTPLALNDGDTVTIEAPRRGVRSYLAIRGGFDIKPVLGSSSTDTLAQLGPAPLQAGEKVFVRETDTKIAVQPSAAPPFAMPATGETVELDVYLGPRSDWFADEAVKLFLTQEWTVGQQSNRVGMRLTGEPLERKIRDELPSEATLSGAIQVPANGQPVLFLTDHPVTGGYPVIATLREEQLSYASQIPAGARIRFNAVETTRKGGRP